MLCLHSKSYISLTNKQFYQLPHILYGWLSKRTFFYCRCFNVDQQYCTFAAVLHVSLLCSINSDCSISIFFYYNAWEFYFLSLVPLLMCLAKILVHHPEIEGDLTFFYIHSSMYNAKWVAIIIPHCGCITQRNIRLERLFFTSRSNFSFSHAHAIFCFSPTTIFLYLYTSTLSQ